jgi:Bacteriophage lambda head decoration protein D
MTTFNEGRHTAEFILSEANGNRSRENVTIAGGTGGAGKVAAGTVLGKLTATGEYVPSPAAGADGSQTAVAILIEAVDATAADVKAAVIARDAEVNGKLLSYEASVDTDPEKAAKAAQLAAVGIIVR